MQIRNATAKTLVLFAAALSVNAFADSFTLAINIDSSLGSMSNADKSVPARTMDSADFTILPGARLKNFLIGAAGQYSIVGQLTDPSNVKGQNVYGSGFLLGPFCGYEFSKIYLDLVLYFFGTYTEAIQQAGQTASYTNPIGGEIYFGYFLGSKIAIFGSLGAIYYNTSIVGSSAVGISSNPFNWTRGAAGISYHFM